MDLQSSTILIILKYAIVAIALMTAFIYIKLAIIYKGQPCAWTKWGIAFIGLYWAFYYTQSIIGSFMLGHQIWVRSPLLITLALFTAMGILSLRKLEK